jgi:hypothetical protein
MLALVVGGTDMFVGLTSSGGCVLPCADIADPHFKQNFAFVEDSYPQDEQMLFI